MTGPLVIHNSSTKRSHEPLFDKNKKRKRDTSDTDNLSQNSEMSNI